MALYDGLLQRHDLEVELVVLVGGLALERAASALHVLAVHDDGRRGFDLAPCAR